MAKLNMELVSAIRMIQNARERTLTEIRRVYSRDAYTDEFKHLEAVRLVEELRITAEGQLSQAAKAVAAKIADLDSEEQKLAELRAVDSDYLNRLNMKMENMERLLHKHIASDGSVSMDDLNDMMRGQMKTYFSEFQNDPIAVGIICERLGLQGVVVAPSDNTGKRQAHLKAVFQVFWWVINKAAGLLGGHGVSEHSKIQDFDAVAKGEEDAFCGYCMAQDETFSLDDTELIEGAGNKQPEMKISYDGILWKIHIAENTKETEKLFTNFYEIPHIVGGSTSGEVTTRKTEDRFVFPAGNEYGGRKLAPHDLVENSPSETRYYK